MIYLITPSLSVELEVFSVSIISLSLLSFCSKQRTKVNHRHKVYIWLYTISYYENSLCVCGGRRLWLCGCVRRIGGRVTARGGRAGHYRAKRGVCYANKSRAKRGVGYAMLVLHKCRDWDSWIKKNNSNVLFPFYTMHCTLSAVFLMVLTFESLWLNF